MINVMIPSGMNELDVATEVLYVGNEIVDVAGKKKANWIRIVKVNKLQKEQFGTS
ncbi:MAG: hypothetical protein ACLUTU_05335 [Blautia faecis]